MVNICTVKGILCVCVCVHRMTVFFDVLFYMQNTEMAKFSVPRESIREFLQTGIHVTARNLTDFDALRLLKQPYTVSVRRTIVYEDGNEEIEETTSDHTGTLSQVLRTLSLIGNNTIVDSINAFLNDKVENVIESENPDGGFNSAAA